MQQERQPNRLSDSCCTAGPNPTQLHPHKGCDVLGPALHFPSPPPPPCRSMICPPLPASPLPPPLPPLPCQTMNCPPLPSPSRPAPPPLSPPLYQAMNCGQPSPTTASDYKVYTETSEDLYSSLATYYDVPTLSFRTATYRLAVHRADGAFNYSNLMSDQCHPADPGHKVGQGRGRGEPDVGPMPPCGPGP